MHLTNTTANTVNTGVCLQSGSTNTATAKCANLHEELENLGNLYASELRKGLFGKNAYHDLMDICHETYVECGEPNKPKSKKKTAKKAVSKTKNR